jgi:potassium efflux system protein
LGDLDFTRQQMLAEATKFAAYLDERLLWVPSSEPINLDTISGLYHSLQWLFSPTNWVALANEIPIMFKHNNLLMPAIIGLFLLLVRLKHWTLQHAKLNETELRHWHTDHFYYTLRALLCLVLLTLPMPMTAYLLGILLTHNDEVDFNQAIGMGLQKAAISAFVWQFFYALFSENGVARQHFQWRKRTVLFLRRHLAWLRFVAIPSMFLIQTTNASKVSEYSDTLGRVALLVMLLAIMVFAMKQLHPKRELWQPWLTKYESQWLVGLPYWCYVLVILVPLVIMGFAVMGYYLSALELQEKLINTLRLLMAALIVHEIIFRWLTLVNRQLALKNAAQHQVLHGQHLAIEDVPPLDIPKINAQARKLLHVTLTLVVILGGWLIWKNILPAFSFLEHIVLWQHKIIVENQESYQPITLTNLLFAGLYLFMAIVSVRNFYAVLELLVFRRWEIETGSRYAINQLANYFFITIAFIAIANELGGSWAQVQWLVAALGVGLGFGLQEIFANLVSGIILLFERPIRVGDTVTIGNVTGKVCRIQMRATTLIDWDQLEFIVPNKTFITSQLTNWTLNDAATRIIIPIGIAFDSDVEFAHALMLQTVKETPFILDDPLPCVLFMGFGESALNFSIRAFVSHPDNRLSMIHALNMRLEKALRENKIVIPFPQRDIHLKM